MGDAGARAWAEVMKDNSKVNGLWLRDNGIGNEEAKAMAKGLENNQAMALVQALVSNRILFSLGLAKYCIGVEGFEALRDACRINERLNMITHGDNSGGERGGENVCETAYFDTWGNLFRHGWT